MVDFSALCKEFTDCSRMFAISWTIAQLNDMPELSRSLNGFGSIKVSVFKIVTDSAMKL